MLYQHKPDYSHLKVFGFLAYSTVTKPHKNKFASRANKAIFLVYIPGEKSYELYDLDSHKIYSSRDVKFYEDHLPFTTSASTFSTASAVPVPVSYNDANANTEHVPILRKGPST